MPYFPPVVLRSGALPAATAQAQTFTSGINGGTAANDDLTLEGTSHATKTSSYVILQPTGGLVGVGTTSPQAPFHLVGTGGLMRLQRASSSAVPTFLQTYNTDNTDGNGQLYAFLSDTTGAGAVTATTIAQWGCRVITHDHATRNSELFFSVSNAGSATERMTLNGAGYLGVGVTAPTAVMHVAASSTARASICLPHGSAPTSPVNGDMWTTTAGLYVQINGSTVGPLS